MDLPSIFRNVACPLLAAEIIFLKVLAEDTEENVIIHPFGKGADAVETHDLGSSITQAAI